MHSNLIRMLGAFGQFFIVLAIATILVCCLIVVLSLWLPLVALAEMTSFIILTVFTVVNLSLWRIRKMPQYQGKLERRTYPVLGAVLCVGLIVLKLFY